MQLLAMMPFEKLKAWQHSHRLTLEVYKVSAGWPPCELYGVVSQTRRAAFSIPANIAEGAAKRSMKEFGHHLNIALGSFSELTYLLRLSLDLEYLSAEQWTALESLRAESGKLIWGLYRRVRAKTGIR